MVDGEEGTEEWLDLTHISALTPGDVPVGQDGDGVLEMELGQGTNPVEVCETELILLEQAQKELEEKAQELEKQYK